MKYIDFVHKNEYKDYFLNLSQKAQSMLITENNGFEVIRMSMPKGNKGVMPPLDKNVTEVYYILEGKISFIYKNKEEILSQGDTFVLRTYNKAIPYVILEDITMILSTNHLEFHKHKKILDQLNTYLDILQDSPLKTKDHCQRLEYLVYDIAKHLNLSAERIENLTYATRFHDVGKIKDGKMNTYASHPRHGYDLVLNYLGEDVATIILQHHERIDGNGFPNGLKGDEIVLEAKILSVVNIYDQYVYNDKLSSKDAIDKIKEGIGSDFDELVVNSLIAILGE